MIQTFKSDRLLSIESYRFEYFSKKFKIAKYFIEKRQPNFYYISHRWIYSFIWLIAKHSPMNHTNQTEKPNSHSKLVIVCWVTEASQYSFTMSHLRTQRLCTFKSKPKYFDAIVRRSMLNQKSISRLQLDVIENEIFQEFKRHNKIQNAIITKHLYSERKTYFHPASFILFLSFTIPCIALESKTNMPRQCATLFT